MKRIGTSIMLITPVDPNGEKHLSISNINFINNTGTGRKLVDVTVHFNNITILELMEEECQCTTQEFILLVL